MKIHIQDNIFYHNNGGCSPKSPPKKFSWDRMPQKTNLVFFTEGCTSLHSYILYKDAKKILWIVEPISVHPYAYEWIKNPENYKNFDLILTHNAELMKLDARFEYCPMIHNLIDESKWKQYPKTKNISIIASAKNFAPGHQLRHQLIRMNANRDLFDVYGYGYNPVEDKTDALRDYRFTLAIENVRIAYYHEKLTDCFATYTIPIYWGCPEIGKFFNPDGIIECNNIGDFMGKIHMLKTDGERIYDSKIKAVEENFKIASEYKCTEDWIYDKILVPKGFV